MKLYFTTLREGCLKTFLRARPIVQCINKEEGFLASTPYLPEVFCRFSHRMILAAAALTDEHTIEENSMKGLAEKTRRKIQRSGRNGRNEELLLD